MGIFSKGYFVRDVISISLTPHISLQRPKGEPPPYPISTKNIWFQPDIFHTKRFSSIKKINKPPVRIDLRTYEMYT